MKYRHVGRHADSLTSGAPVGPGEEVSLTDAQAENEPLIEEGVLIPIETKKSTKKEGESE